MAAGGSTRERLTVGRVGAPHGVRGWLRIDSATRPPEAILGFDDWWLVTAQAVTRYRLQGGDTHAGRIVARLEGIDDRSAAAALRHARIEIERAALPDTEAGEWYWADLIGLDVVTTAGDNLGQVDHLLETGANDVLVIRGEREHLVPWIRDDVIRSVDPAGGWIVVDWDPDF